MKSSHKFWGYLIAVILSLCCICAVGAYAINVSSGSILSTPTISLPLSPTDSLIVIIEKTAHAAQTQTAQAGPPVSLATATLVPSVDTIPTATIFIFQLQTNVAQPTEYIFSTNTPFSISTLPPSSGEVCSCNGGLDCKDFSTHNQAQACYEYCRSLGYGDVHGLDGNDQDGLACESLP